MVTGDDAARSPRRLRIVRNIALFVALPFYAFLSIRLLVVAFRAEEWVGVFLGAAALVVLGAGAAAIWVASNRS